MAKDPATATEEGADAVHLARPDASRCRANSFSLASSCLRAASPRLVTRPADHPFHPPSLASEARTRRRCRTHRPRTGTAQQGRLLPRQCRYRVEGLRVTMYLLSGRPVGQGKLRPRGSAVALEPAIQCPPQPAAQVADQQCQRRHGQEHRRRHGNQQPGYSVDFIRCRLRRDRPKNVTANPRISAPERSKCQRRPA